MPCSRLVTQLSFIRSVLGRARENPAFIKAQRMLLLDVADDPAQQIDMADQQILLAVGQIDGEEPTGSAGLGTAIAH